MLRKNPLIKSNIFKLFNETKQINIFLLLIYSDELSS